MSKKIKQNKSQNSQNLNEKKINESLENFNSDTQNIQNNFQKKFKHFYFKIPELIRMIF